MAKTSEILLEYRQDGRKTWAIRFFHSGVVREYSDSRMEFKNGEIVTRPMPLAWREIARLTAGEMDKLLATLRKANFFSLPGQVGDTKGIMDATTFTWTVHMDGQEKTVTAAGSEASNHPALKLLREMIQEVTADAFDRQAGEK